MNYIIGLTKIVELVKSIIQTRNNLFHYELENDFNYEENNFNEDNSINEEGDNETTNDSEKIVKKMFFFRLINHFSFITALTYQLWNFIKNLFKFLSLFLELVNGFLEFFYFIYYKIKPCFNLINITKLREEKDTIDLKSLIDIPKQHERGLNTEKKQESEVTNG
jgi:hypothetical protein